MIEIGREVEVETIGNNGRQTIKGKVISVEFHEGLSKNVYTIITPYGNRARLTFEEITRVL